ncbi:MAG: hypothetical protein K2H60_17160 [Muribaculaceae bacterium]|nr:hypothetical protein [Muribaculaceae bacterium]
MADKKIQINPLPNSFWLAKESFLGGRNIYLFLNGKEQLNRYHCKDKEEYMSLIATLNSIASLFNSSYSKDVNISRREYELSQSEKFKEFLYSLSNSIEFNGIYPNLTVYITHEWPSLKLTSHINGKDIICNYAIFNFRTRELKVSGRDRQNNKENVERIESVEYRNILYALLRAYYLINIEFISRFMNFSFHPVDLLEKAIEKGFITVKS